VIGLVVTHRQRRERQKKATCPYCGHTDSLVCASGRETEAPTYDEHLKGFVRCRRCQQCQKIFRTVERVLR
jgi:transcriptional regulator NrdR family protein